MTKRKAKAVKAIKAWGGFSEGKLHSWDAADSYDSGPQTHREFAIYQNRHDARKRYEDVRRVTITVDKP